jgi:hypothetical protein
MTLIKKCDVKTYRASRPNRALRPSRPANEVGRIRLPEIESGEADSNTSGFVEDFVREHSSSGGSAIAVAIAVATKTVPVLPTADAPGV